MHQLSFKTNRRDCCACSRCLGFLLAYRLLVHMEIAKLFFKPYTQLEREYRAVTLWNWDTSLILIRYTLPVFPASLPVFTLLTPFYSYHSVHVIIIKVFKCVSRKPAYRARSRAQISTSKSEIVTCHLYCDWYVNRIYIYQLL